MNQRPIYARSKPLPQPITTTYQICRRCGIEFNPHKNHPTHCRDCRGYLKETK